MNNYEYQINLFQEEVKPFLKWAGGKSQLIPELVSRMPEEYLRDNIIPNYIEPFLGGGALFFYLKSYFQVERSVIIDINPDLICCYKVVQKDVTSLIDILKMLEDKYILLNEKERENMFYKIRDEFNESKQSFNINTYNEDWISRAAKMIFLNKTCYNGLYRQNRKGLFNVPHGRYKNPTICPTNDLLLTANALKDTEIICGDFEQILQYVTNDTFIYYDPPYRPLNDTSSFNSYAKEGFDDIDQIKLATIFKEINKIGAYQMLSNSDPKNENPNDNFFDDLYKEFNIVRVNAKRIINSNASKRGKISEIIVTNYKY